MKIALAQINPYVGDIEGNKLKIIHKIQKARSENVDIILFPELCITGYPAKDLLGHKEFIEKNRTALDEIAARSEDITALVGFVDIDRTTNAPDGKFVRYNSVAIIKDGKIEKVQHKSRLPTYDVFDEARHFIPGEGPQVFECCEKKIGMVICEEMWDRHYKTDLCRILVEEGAEMIFSISASPFRYGKNKERQDILKEKSKKLKVPFFYVNQTGGQDEIVFDGESIVTNARGELCAIGNKFEEDFIIVDTDNMKKIPDERYSEAEEIHDALILGLRDYFKKSNLKGAVIGISGGIDSAVTAAIAVRSLGKENVLGVMMPTEYTSRESIKDAKELSKKLDIELKTIDINELFYSFKSNLSGILKTGDTAEENLQARIRGTILMAIANSKGYVLLATGNKSELAVGYSTLYGDMAGGLSVISDLLKKRVYELANYINEEKELIPLNIINKAPSAELKPGQKDEDELPPYRILDDIIVKYIVEGKSLRQITEEGHDKEIVRWVIDRINKNEFKRRQAPPGIKITPKAFGSGRQMPIVNKYQEN